MYTIGDSFTKIKMKKLHFKNPFGISESLERKLRR